MIDEYNRTEFHSPPGGWEHVDFQPDLRVGILAPDFSLPEVYGGVFRLSEVTASRHAPLIFGCMTSPATATHLPKINHMWEPFT